MPVYEYECGKCSCRFEVRQGFDDSPVAVCPRCRGKARRVFVPVPVIFKGSGFYVTDHRKDDKGNGKKEGMKESPKEAMKESPKKTKEIASKAKD